jgi:hypothetical protein
MTHGFLPRHHAADAGIIHKPANPRDLETMRAYVKLLR